MRQSMAAAERARRREKQRMVTEGVLNESYFEKGGFDSTRNQGNIDESEEDELERPSVSHKGGPKFVRGGAEASKRFEEADGPLTAFNMEEENETGYLDESGNYVWRRRDVEDDGDNNGAEEEDPWFQSLKEGGDGKVELANVKEKKTNVHKKRTLKQTKSKQACLDSIYHLLLNNETVMDALKRLGKKDAKDLANLNQLTEDANQLIESIPGIYSMTKRLIDGEIGDERKLIMAKTFWEYRTSLDPKAEIYGPYCSLDMQAWREDGYFEGDDQTVYVRQTNGTPADSGTSKKQKLSELANDFDEEEEDDEEEVENDSNSNSKGRDGNDTSAWQPVEKVVFTRVFP